MELRSLPFTMRITHTQNKEQKKTNKSIGKVYHLEREALFNCFALETEPLSDQTILNFFFNRSFGSADFIRFSDSQCPHKF